MKSGRGDGPGVTRLPALVPGETASGTARHCGKRTQERPGHSDAQLSKQPVTGLAGLFCSPWASKTALTCRDASCWYRAGNTPWTLEPHRPSPQLSRRGRDTRMQMAAV